MSESIISRVYDLKIAGYDDSLQKVKALTVAFGKMDAAKKKLNDQLQKKLDSGDVTAVKELSARIKELETNMSNLSAKRENSAKEAALMAQAEKNLAAAEKTRMSNIIQQEKELDRLIAKEEKQNKTVNQSTGYYYDLLNAQKAALQLYRQTAPDSPLYEQIKKGAIDAKAKVDAFNRSLSPDGTLVGEYKTGILNAFKDLGLSDVLKKQSNDINSQLNKLKEESRQLATEYKKTADSGTKSFSEVEHQLKTNLEQQEKLKQSLTNLDTALKGTGNIGAQITSGISEGFKNAKQQVSQLVLGYVGFQAVFSGLRSGVGIAKELSDQTTNLEIELGKTAGSGKKLVDELAKLDTRTKLTGLEDIANIAAKAGVSEDRIVGVTQAIDKIKIAFGKDFGDVETGTESLVKLVNVFEGTDQVTGDNLLRVGNAVRTLANETVASVPFLNDFSKRMAGLKGISDISLPAVLGLGSGFEQFGQSAEVAGTTLTKVIPKLATNTEKYSKVAGITQQAFSDLLKNDPAEALIKVSEGLVKSKGGIEEISTAFADSQLGSGRIAAILGTVGNKADDFRKAIASAGKAYNDTGNIETAFAEKNKNLAATLDKVTKAFADTANSKLFQAIINGIAVAIIFLINNFPALLTVLGLYAAGWALANKQMIIARYELIFQRTVLPVLTFLLGGQANAMKAYAFATELAGKSLKILSTLMGNPIFKIFAVTLGLGLIALESFGKSVNNVAGAYGKLAQKQNFLNEIQATATKQINETKAKEEALLAVVRDRTLADGTRAKALENLKNIAGGYLDQLSLENVITEKGTKLIDDFNNQLERKARLTAADAIAQRENNKLAQLYQNQFDIQTAIKTKGSINTSQFSKEFLDEFYAQQGRSASAIGKFIGDKVGVEFTYSGKDLELFSRMVKNQIQQQLAKTAGSEIAKTQVTNDNIKSAAKDLKDAKKQVDELTNKLSGIKEGTKEYADASKALSEAQKDVLRKRSDLLQLINKPAPINSDGANISGDTGSVTLDELKKQLANINNQISSLDKIKAKSETQLTQLKNLRKQRGEILKQIKELGGGKTKTYRGSRLTGEQRDAVKDIEAERDEQIAVEKLKFAQLQENEQTYLNNILKINTDAADKKLALLKGKNAEERKQIAELQLYKIDQETETNKALFDLSKKELDRNFDAAKRQGQSQVDKVNDDPTKTDQDKRRVKESFLSAQYISQFIYNEKLAALEKKYGQQSLDETKKRNDELADIQKSYNKNELEITIGTLEDIDQATDQAIVKIKLKYDKLRAEILNSDKSQNKKNDAIGVLNNTEDIEVGATKLSGSNAALSAAQKLLAAKSITQKEYEAIVNQVNADQQNLSDLIEKNVIKITDLRSLVSNKVRTLFSFDDVKGDNSKLQQAQKDLEAGKISQEAFNDISKAIQKNIGLRELYSQTISTAFNTAGQAMNNFYDAEANRIDQSNQLAQKKLDIELQQAEDRSQSQAETDSLERQFAAKKDAESKKSFEKNKKLQIEQAKINLAIQLSNLAVIAFSPNPLNIATLGIAGTIMYGIQAALAFVNYASNVSKINSAQYAKGGKVVNPTKVGNGKITVPSNIKTQPNGDNIFATVRTNEVILNEEQQKKLGGPQAFKAIGVPGFADGGFTGLGGSIGQKWDKAQPPINPGAFLNPGRNNNTATSEKTEQQMNKLMSMIAETSRQTNQRIDKIKVQVVSKEVEDSNNNRKKASAIGTI